MQNACIRFFRNRQDICRYILFFISYLGIKGVLLKKKLKIRLANLDKRRENFISDESKACVHRWFHCCPN